VGWYSAPRALRIRGIAPHRAEDSRHCAAPRWLKVSFEFDPDLPLQCVLSLHDNFGAAFQISKFILLNTTTPVVARKHLSGNENSCSYICSNLRRQQKPLADGENGMANPRQAERDSSESMHETTRRVADQASQTSRTVSDAAERTARAGTEAFRRNAETFSSTWRNSSEAASRIAERSVDQFSKLFGLTGDTARETMQQSAGNVQALIESSTFVVDGLQNVSGEWMRFMQNRIEENLEHFEELLGCRTAHECMALQTRMVRDNIEALLHSARRASEVSTKLADDAVRRISDTALAPR
jgi:phasin family protein